MDDLGMFNVSVVVEKFFSFVIWIKVFMVFSLFMIVCYLWIVNLILYGLFEFVV